MDYFLNYGFQHLVVFVLGLVLIIIFGKLKYSALTHITLVILVAIIITPLVYFSCKYTYEYECEHEYVYKGKRNDYLVVVNYYFISNTDDIVENKKVYVKSKPVVDLYFKNLEKVVHTEAEFLVAVTNLGGNFLDGVKPVTHNGRCVSMFLRSTQIERVSK